MEIFQCFNQFIRASSMTEFSKEQNKLSSITDYHKHYRYKTFFSRFTVSLPSKLALISRNYNHLWRHDRLKFNFIINKTARSLNIFFCKKNKRCYYLFFTIYSVFTFQRPSSEWQISSSIHTILKVKKKIEIIYNVAIDTQLKSIKKLQRNRIVVHLEGRATLLHK